MAVKQVFFRVDGDAKIGLGHLVRCIALAKMLKCDFELTFVCKQIPQYNVSELKEAGINLILIQHENDFLSLLNHHVIVVLDHYSLDTTYQKSIKNIGCKLVCVDDLHDKVFYADLIINHAPNILPSDYQAQSYTQFALGLEYVLLRPAFLNNKKAYVASKKVKTAFVCFGGADIKNLTCAVVEILKADSRFTKIIAVTGPAYKYAEQLNHLIQGDPRLELHHSIDENNMAGLMSETDIAIVPASGILQEALAIGTRVISGMYVENQRHMFENYKALEAFSSAESFETGQIKNAIENIFDGVKLPSKMLIDGKSSKRILGCFKQFQLEENISLRRATVLDLNKTFEWASDTAVRKFFFNSSPVSFEEHKSWFNKKVIDPNCNYYIGIMGNDVIGSVRFDVTKNKAVVSYLIDPAFQNKGLGTILLKNGLELFLKETDKAISEIYGEALNQNLASIKIFQKLGYLSEDNPSNNSVNFKKILTHLRSTA